MLLLFLAALFLSIILMNVNSLLSFKMIKDREKMSPFECGFDPSSSSRNPFSLKFFLIAIMFLIFDVEIALILPIPIIFVNNTNNSLILTLTTIFLIILLAGILYEWKNGALEWF